MKFHLKPLLARIAFLIIAMMAAASPAVMASEATVSGGISVLNEGSLSVTLGTSEITFVTESGGPAQISASTGDTQYAQIPITIVDDRAEGARDPWSVSLHVTSLSIDGTPYYIDANNIVFTSVTDLPEGISQAWIGESGVANASAEGVPVIRSGETPSAGTHTVTVQVRMNVPAGTVPGNYTGRILLSLNPGIDP